MSLESVCKRLSSQRIVDLRANHLSGRAITELDDVDATLRDRACLLTTDSVDGNDMAVCSCAGSDSADTVGYRLVVSDDRSDSH